MAESSTSGAKITPLKTHRFHPWDSKPIGRSGKLRLADQRKTISGLYATPRMSLKRFEAVTRKSINRERTQVLITNVYPKNNRVMSDVPFELIVDFDYYEKHIPALVSVRVDWAGETFIVQQLLTEKEIKRKRVIVHFNKEQTLPSGYAVFHVDMYSEQGAQSSFRTSCTVLPSNPLSLTISPRTNFVTGTNSARGVRESGDFKTRISLNISNGDATSVTINSAMTWKFWDGGVGGTLVESGTHNWGSFTISAFSNSTRTLTFTSPNGSGIFNRYNDKEDMTIELEFTTTDGRSIDDTLTARVMAGFGMNVTRVGGEDFTSQEYTDLYDAVDLTQDIYENRDITFSGISRRHIPNASVGGYRTINSENEARSMFDDWSGPDNDFIDLFVAHDFTTSFNGLAGDIPGPTSHNGRRSGIYADKSGFVDSSGNDRLNVNYLGVLIAHEAGHYLGLSHVTTDGNVMFGSGVSTNDTTLTYDQYKTILDFGWVTIV